MEQHRNTSAAGPGQWHLYNSTYISDHLQHKSSDLVSVCGHKLMDVRARLVRLPYCTEAIQINIWMSTPNRFIQGRHTLHTVRHFTLLFLMVLIECLLFEDSQIILFKFIKLLLYKVRRPALFGLHM